ncbi:MAG: BTAD domain-containing putative transcriptional regulator [Caldilineaceae bacterium]
MPTLSLRLLGDLQVTMDGIPVNGFVTRKAQALLVYLATTQTVQSRDKVASLLWPEMPEQNARNNLRRVLPNLRTLVGNHLIITHQTIAFKRNASYVLDVEKFAGTRVLPSAETNLAALSSVELVAKVNLYQGDFLQNFHIPNAPEFEEWMLLEREHLRQRAIRFLSALANRYMQAGDTAGGLSATRRLLALEPWHETAHEQQMLLLAQSGQRTAALAQYESCRELLAAEFGVKPSAQMTAHYERIKVGVDGETILSDAPSTQAIVVAPPVLSQPVLSPPVLSPPVVSQPVVSQIEVNNMPRPAAFYGRHREITELTQWLTTEPKAIIGLLGTGGTGKTMLAAELVRTFARAETASAVGAQQPPFTQVIWCSLLHGPSFAALLRTWLQTLADQHQDQLPVTASEQLDLLFTQLRRKRCLLILDNLESLLSPDGQAGAFRNEYVDYEYFFGRMGETEHRSCLLFTSRELPTVVGKLERTYPMVRTYTVRGLDTESGVRLLKAEGLSGAQQQLADLAQRYSGNPLALRLVAETVQELFGGHIDTMLQDRTLIFDDIRTVLDQQVSRLSALELEILYWLAIERAPTSLQALAQNWIQPPARTKFVDAVRSLQRRGLLEHAVDAQPNSFNHANRATRFTLQNVVMEYISELLIEHFYQEVVGIEAAPPIQETLQRSLWLNRFGLVKAQSPAYLTDAQIRLLLQPVIRRLLGYWGYKATVSHLRQWLTYLRACKLEREGYAGANLFHLLCRLDIDLTGWDFSGLPLRQADLRANAVVALNLRGADLTGTALINQIDIVNALALSQDGQYLATGSSDGVIYIWPPSTITCTVCYAITRNRSLPDLYIR